MKQKQRVSRSISLGVALVASVFVCSSLSNAICLPSWAVEPSQTLSYDMTYTSQYPTYVPSVACAGAGSVTSGQWVNSPSWTCIYPIAQVQGTCQVYEEEDGVCIPNGYDYDWVANVYCDIQWPNGTWYSCGLSTWNQLLACEGADGEGCQSFDSNNLNATSGTNGPVIPTYELYVAGWYTVLLTLNTNPSSCDSGSPPAQVYQEIYAYCDGYGDCYIVT
jgi:hypothetical protein